MQNRPALLLVTSREVLSTFTGQKAGCDSPRADVRNNGRARAVAYTLYGLPGDYVIILPQNYYYYRNSVSIVTGCGQDCPRIEPGEGEIFRTSPNRSWVPAIFL